MARVTPPRPLRVLVIEHDLRLRDLYVEVLTRAGYEVEVVPTVGLAIEALLSRPADVIIASPHGVVPADLLAALHGVAPRLPVIMCSGIVVSGRPIVSHRGRASRATQGHPYGARQGRPC